MKHIKIAAGLDRYFDYGYVQKNIEEADKAGCDLFHSDAIGMDSMKRAQLIGGHNVIMGISNVTKKDIECHFYSDICDLLFIEKIARHGCKMLILPAESFMGEHLATIIYWCHSKGMKIGLTVGRYAPLSLIEESIFDIDRIHVLTHINNPETGEHFKDQWNKNSISVIKRARKLIEEKNPNCELSVEGGITSVNVDEIVECNPDVIIFSSAIFQQEDDIIESVKKCRIAVDSLTEKFGL